MWEQGVVGAGFRWGQAAEGSRRWGDRLQGVQRVEEGRLQVGAGVGENGVVGQAQIWAGAGATWHGNRQQGGRHGGDKGQERSLRDRGLPPYPLVLLSVPQQWRG